MPTTVMDWADTSGSVAGCVVVLSRGKALRIMAEVARLEEAHNDGHPFPDASTEDTPRGRPLLGI